MVPRKLLLASACVIVCGPVAAQEADVSSDAATSNAELPEIEVTSPSPIKKPAKPKKAAAAPAPASATPQLAADDDPFADAQIELGEIDAASQLNTVPGTLLVTPDTFASVTVTTKTELESNQGATITETLSLKPGIAGTTFAPGANRPILRGLDTYRIRVQEGGIGTHDVAALSEDHAVPVDPSSADRIEVIRGPATLRYGSHAIGGLVSIENQRVPTYIPKGGLSGVISGGATSVDDSRNGSFVALAGMGGFAVHADGFKRDY